MKNALITNQPSPPTSSGEGAAVLTSIWIALQYADIQGASYYRGNDVGDVKSKAVDAENNQPGLIDADGNIETVGYAFRLWSVLTSNYQTLLNTNLPTWALAAKNASGGNALLIANTTSSDITYSVSLAGEIQTGSMTVYLVDDTHDGKNGSVVDGSIISLPAYSVELVTF